MDWVPSVPTEPGAVVGDGGPAGAAAGGGELPRGRRFPRRSRLLFPELTVEAVVVWREVDRVMMRRRVMRSGEGDERRDRRIFMVLLRVGRRLKVGGGLCVCADGVRR